MANKVPWFCTSACSGNLFGPVVPSMCPPFAKGDGEISSAATPGKSLYAPLITGENWREIMVNKIPWFLTNGCLPKQAQRRLPLNGAAH